MDTRRGGLLLQVTTMQPSSPKRIYNGSHDTLEVNVNVAVAALQKVGFLPVSTKTGLKCFLEVPHCFWWFRESFFMYTDTQIETK